MNPLLRWLVASRASVLLMTLTSAMIGVALAARDGHFHPWVLAGLIVGLLLAHATNNLLNDFTDSIRGVDKDNYHRAKYGTHALEAGYMSRKQMLLYIAITGGLAIAVGAALVWWRGGLTLPLMAAGAFFVLFYTWPLKYIGLGEPAVLLVWGPLMVGGSYYVMSGEWSYSVALFSCIYAIAPTVVLFGKHIDKMAEDRAKKIYTLPVLLGDRGAKLTAAALLITQYLLVGAAVAEGFLNLTGLVMLLNLPLALHTIRVFLADKPETMPEGFPPDSWPLWYAPHGFQHTRKFCGWLLLALLLELVWV